jgi:predicted nucleotidyltransferase
MKKKRNKALSIEKIKALIIPVLKKYGVQKAALYGSFVRGEQIGRSDVNILVEFRDRANKTLLDLVGLELEIEELLGCKVDVLT